MTALELRGVCKTRGEGAHRTLALSDVSLVVEAGEVTMVEGPSGSGKTSLLAVAGGLLTVDKGEVWLGRERISHLGRSAGRRLRSRDIGVVFQRANLLPELSALDNVLLQAALAGMPALDARRRALELMEKLGVASLAARKPRQLSGGQEQRVAVARALVHRPIVVLADEPTASLDAASGQSVAHELTMAGREAGAAVLVATHDSRLAPHATRRVTLVDGRLRVTPAPLRITA